MPQLPGPTLGASHQASSPEATHCLLAGVRGLLLALLQSEAFTEVTLDPLRCKSAQWEPLL